MICTRHKPRYVNYLPNDDVMLSSRERKSLIGLTMQYYRVGLCVLRTLDCDHRGRGAALAPAIAQIPLDLSCRTTCRTTSRSTCRTTCRRPGRRQVGDQVSDFFLLKTCRKPGFKQVLSKTDVMEFRHMPTCSADVLSFCLILVYQVTLSSC